ncbi:MAG: hypothetical protein KGI33_12290 [Thaumarchaeota archaeon]|nr:hypothetical protein [Nitrososphaerota archaeon]
MSTINISYVSTQNGEFYDVGETRFNSFAAAIEYIFSLGSCYTSQDLRNCTEKNTDGSCKYVICPDISDIPTSTDIPTLTETEKPDKKNIWIYVAIIIGFLFLLKR